MKPKRSMLAATGVGAAAAPFLLTFSINAAAGPNGCESRTNNSTATLLECVTLEGVRQHQAALQEIADANGGTRVSATPGYDRSVDYVAGKLRDAGYVVSVLLQMLIFLTPIFYPVERLPTAALQAVMRLNPLSVVVESARAVIMYDRTPDWVWLGVVTLVGLAALQLGYVWFMKTRRGFADVL